MSSLILTPRRRCSIEALALALLLEAALVAGASILLAGTATPALSEPVAITLLAEEKVPEKAPEKPAAPLPVPLPVPLKTLPTLKTLVRPEQPEAQAAPQQEKAALPVTENVSSAAVGQTALSEPAPAPVRPTPASAAKDDPSMAYAAKVHAAVQAAHYYPPAAAALRFSGRVRVEFHLKDGIPGAAQVLISCGVGMIDRAASQAVQSAHYPLPPDEMLGIDHAYQVWVEFMR